MDGPAADLAWADNSAVEDGSEVQRAYAEGGPYSGVATLPANSTTYHDVVVLSRTTYWYQVRAKKDGGFSDFSNTASAALPCVPIPEICGNALDDDCDGLPDVADTVDCPCAVQECFSENCPPGYVCAPEGCCVPPGGDL